MISRTSQTIGIFLIWQFLIPAVSAKRLFGKALRAGSEGNLPALTCDDQASHLTTLASPVRSQTPLPSTTAEGQVAVHALQHVQITDKLVGDFLANFWLKTDQSSISVLIQVDPKDNGYVYQVGPIYHIEMIESFSSGHWGLWRGKIILFYGPSNLTTIYQIRNTTDLANLKQYASGLLPRAVVYKKGSHDVRMGAFYEGPSAIMKLLEGREVYYYDGTGYDSRDIPDELPPVPEAKKP